MNVVSPQVRTTAPEKYRVKPSSSCCEPGTSVDIVVSLHGGTALLLCTLLHSQQMFQNAELRNNEMVQSITISKCQQPLFFAWHTYFKCDKRIISPKQTIRQLTAQCKKKFLAIERWNVNFNSDVMCTTSFCGEVFFLECCHVPWRFSFCFLFCIFFKQVNRLPWLYYWFKQQFKFFHTY